MTQDGMKEGCEGKEQSVHDMMLSVHEQDSIKEGCQGKEQSVHDMTMRMNKMV